MSTIGWITPPGKDVVSVVLMQLICSSDQLVQRANVPNELPTAAIPVATAILVVKYVLMIAMPGMNSIPIPPPMQNACASKTCQYLVHRLNIIWPRTTKKVPPQSSSRKYPASYNGPVQVPTSITRKDWMDPIHEIVLGLVSCKRSNS